MRVRVLAVVQRALPCGVQKRRGARAAAHLPPAASAAARTQSRSARCSPVVVTTSGGGGAPEGDSGIAQTQPQLSAARAPRLQLLAP